MTRLGPLVSSAIAALAFAAGAGSTTRSDPPIVFATGTSGPQARNTDIHVRDADGTDGTNQQVLRPGSDGDW